MVNIVEKALIVAYNAHSGQVRKYDGTPYVVHPIRVAAILKEHGFTEELMQAAALLHDVVEDTLLTTQDINKEFGPLIAGLVGEVTDKCTKENYPNLNRKTRKKMELERLIIASPEARALKLADMIDNTQSLDPTDKFVDVYSHEKDTMLRMIGHTDTGLTNEARNALDALLKRRAAVIRALESIGEA